jgi:hypothetical protein
LRTTTQGILNRLAGYLLATFIKWDQASPVCYCASCRRRVWRVSLPSCPRRTACSVRPLPSAPNAKANSPSTVRVTLKTRLTGLIVFGFRADFGTAPKRPPETGSGSAQSAEYRSITYFVLPPLSFRDSMPWLRPFAKAHSREQGSGAQRRAHATSCCRSPVGVDAEPADPAHTPFREELEATCLVEASQFLSDDGSVEIGKP